MSRTPHRPALRAGVVLTSALALVLPLGAGGAQAKPIERDRYHDFGSEPFTDCPGLDVQLDYDVHGHFTFSGRGPHGFPHLREHRRGSLTFVNLDTGRQLVNTFTVNSKDLEVVDNGDGTLTLTVLATGSEKYYGDDGKLLLANPGQVRYQILLDHGGTPTDPSDDVFLEDLGLIKGSTGRNDTEGRDFCADLATFTG